MNCLLHSPKNCEKIYHYPGAEINKMEYLKELMINGAGPGPAKYV